MNRSYEALKEQLRPQLDSLNAKLGAATVDGRRATVICIPRHGYATTRINVDSLYERTAERFLLIYVDVGSPPNVREYLEEQAKIRPDFFYLRVDEMISRQTARLLVLDLVPTPYTVFMDNNMLLGDGWLSSLIRTAEQDAADVVSPFIVMQGGNVHFSGSKIVKVSDTHHQRKQTTAECPLGAPLSEVTPRKLEIDFAESHCCLMRTKAFRARIDELFMEDMHNSHTLAVASYLLKTRHGSRMLVDPGAVVYILPVGFGYDIPWLFGSYNDLACFKASYTLHEAVAGRASSSILNNLRWHRKHLLYLLLSMTGNRHLERTDMLKPAEVPSYIDGYDKALPEDIIARVEDTVMPFLERHYPQYRPHLLAWLYDISGIIADIDRKADELAAGSQAAWWRRRPLWWKRMLMPAREWTG
jgi:hypothetical protein